MRPSEKKSDFGVIIMIICWFLGMLFLMGVMEQAPADQTTQEEIVMAKQYTEIVCIIDRSGSMEIIRNDAIGGFNAFIEEQKKLPGEATVTYVQFDTEYEVVFEGKPLQDVQPIDHAVYVPRGSTALLDAVGRTINEVGARLARMDEAERPAQVIMVILTDGEENSSREMTHDKIKEMITHQQEKYNWQFVFLAANQDAFASAGSIGITNLNNIHNFNATAEGIRNVYSTTSDTVGGYRTK